MRASNIYFSFLAYLNNSEIHFGFTGQIKMQVILCLHIILKRVYNSVPFGLYRKSSSGDFLLFGETGHSMNNVKSIPIEYFVKCCQICSNDNIFKNKAKVIHGIIILYWIRRS